MTTGMLNDISAGTLELVHVALGSLALEVDGVVHIVVAGASAFAHTDRPHAYACSGRKRTHFTMVVSEPASPQHLGASARLSRSTRPRFAA